VTWGGRRARIRDSGYNGEYLEIVDTEYLDGMFGRSERGIIGTFTCGCGVNANRFCWKEAKTLCTRVRKTRGTDF
jgi:hypothetical protein